MSTVKKKIRVMVVDDSVVARGVIIQGLSAYPNIEVIGYAINALDAKSKIAKLNPDVMTLDVEMPGISGIDFLKEFLPTRHLPVILVSSLSIRVFEALASGAVDFVRKPHNDQSTSDFIAALAQKIVVASYTKPRLPESVPKPSNTPADAIPLLGNHPALDQVMIGLGASTGGTEATLDVLKRLPADIPGMVIVQHMPTGFTKMYADRLNRLCNMEVREGTHGDEIRRGLVLIAPADLQTRVISVGNRYLLSCKPDEKVSGHRPSVDALFSSIASTVRWRQVGIIMTGMGRDGATGLLAMRKAGAYTIGQDKESSVVYGMPMVAQELGAVCIQSSCENISSVLLRHLKTL